MSPGVDAATLLDYISVQVYAPVIIVVYASARAH
jgi:hypothetical protein